MRSLAVAPVLGIPFQGFAQECHKSVPLGRGRWWDTQGAGHHIHWTQVPKGRQGGCWNDTPTTLRTILSTVQNLLKKEARRKVAIKVIITAYLSLPLKKPPNHGSPHPWNTVSFSQYKYNYLCTSYILMMFQRLLWNQKNQRSASSKIKLRFRKITWGELELLCRGCLQSRLWAEAHKVRLTSTNLCSLITGLWEINDHHSALWFYAGWASPLVGCQNWRRELLKYRFCMKIINTV